MALPVLDRMGRLVGLVEANQVVEVIRREATEDMQLMVGLSGEERTLTPWKLSMKRRLPWLCINLGTAFLAAAVVGMFEQTIAAWTALARKRSPSSFATWPSASFPAETVEKHY